MDLFELFFNVFDLIGKVSPPIESQMTAVEEHLGLVVEIEVFFPVEIIKLLLDKKDILRYPKSIKMACKGSDRHFYSSEIVFRHLADLTVIIHIHFRAISLFVLLISAIIKFPEYWVKLIFRDHLSEVDEALEA